MSALDLIALRGSFDGGFPALIATCAPDGTPNMSVLSDVRLVDERHLALSYQFFNKTRANILVNPRARLQVTDPHTGARHLLTVRYLRTEAEGALFVAMKARLAGIAAHSGMSKVFHLRGADVYEVESIERLSGPLTAPAGGAHCLTALRTALPELRASADLTGLLDATLHALTSAFGFGHCMLLLADSVGQHLFTVASAGYAESGVGSEIAFGEGVIGIAAAACTPLRMTHMAQDYLYSEVVRAQFMAANPNLDLEQRIALPGLAESRSQLAVPIMRGPRVLGVIYVESPYDGSLTQDEEDACVVLADQFAAVYGSYDEREQPLAEAREKMATIRIEERGHSPLPPRRVRHDAHDHGVFVDGEYLIKGVAGAILWRMLQDYVATGRIEFSNRELRRDRQLGLPEIVDNLEARLVLLQRRLAERMGEFLALEKAGRGRYRLVVSGPLELTDNAARA